jgi:hypothetical protein
VRGFILHKMGDYPQGGRPAMENVAIGQCKTKGCNFREDPFYFTVCFCSSDDLPGLWELYVVADGAPVTVTFKLKGVHGEARVSVNDPVTSEIKTLRPRFYEEGPSSSVYSTGDFTTLDSSDYGLIGFWFTGVPYAASAGDDCIYWQGGTHPPEEQAFLPGCPTRPSADPFVFVNPSMGRGNVMWTTSGICCPVGLGGWFATAAEVKRHGAVALWIDYVRTGQT